MMARQPRVTVMRVVVSEQGDGAMGRAGSDAVGGGELLHCRERCAWWRGSRW